MKRTKEYWKEYWHTHPDKYQKNKGQVKNRRKKIRIECLIHYGGNPPKCACCDESHIEFLLIDHIYGGGTQQRKVVKSSMFYRWLIENNFPEDLQVLCANCNMAKGRSKTQFCPIHHPKL